MTDDGGACGLSDVFENVGGYWVVRAKDGSILPVFYCPMCGTRIDYGRMKMFEE